MFADDLVLIGRADEMKVYAEVVEDWAQDNNMKINKNKSALMFIGKESPEASLPHGYPVRPSYKYLGTTISSNLSIHDHLNEVARKVNYILFQMRAVLNKCLFKLNSSLFKTLILPLYRLALSLVKFLPTTQIVFLEQQIRKYFRKFNRMPRRTPNVFIHAIIGTVEQMRDIVVTSGDIKILARSQNRALTVTEKSQIQDIKSKKVVAKVLPNDLLLALRIAYGKVCASCNTLATFGHIHNHHRGPGRKPWVPMTELFQRLQDPKSRASAKSDIKVYLRTAIQITAK